MSRYPGTRTGTKIIKTHETFLNIFWAYSAGEPLKDVVIKAQVLSGGRGIGTFNNGFKGGVHIVTKPGQARDFASKMLFEKLMTKQAPNGILCSKVVSNKVVRTTEYYDHEK
jgi:succinyl-CoA synthetase beta subunit